MKELKRALSNYTFIDILRLFRDKLLTIIFFNSNIRIIRNPFYIVGKKYIEFGKDFQSGPRLRIEVIDAEFARYPIDSDAKKPLLKIGDNVSFNYNVHIGVLKKIYIGNNTLLGSNVSIIDHNHGNYIGEYQDNPSIAPRDRTISPQSIFIGNNVWIAENVVVLPGAYIADGCIVGANAVVTGKFDKNTMIAGVPAKALKQFDEQSKKWKKL